MVRPQLLENIKTTIILGISFVLLFLFAYTKAFANPVVDQVVSGSVDFVNIDEHTLQINASDKAIVNYKSFDIAENEKVIFNFADKNNEILNRVTGNSSSNILGSLFSNGIVFLVNQNGIYFGPNSNIDVQGLVASTRDITDSDFLSSKYNFQRMSKEQLDTLLLNKGNINIREGGFGVFIAGAVENQGTIIAPLGTIAIAGAEMVTLNIAGNGSISIAINKAQAEKVYDLTGSPIVSQIKNSGTISAPGGAVLLSAESLPDVFEMAINLDGYVKADSYNGNNGLVKIETTGKVNITGSVQATNISIGSKDMLPEVVEAKTANITATQAVEVAARSLSLTSNSPLTYIYKPQDMLLTSAALKDNNLINLQGAGIDVTYSMANGITIEAGGALNTTPGVIIQANSVKLIAQKFGSTDAPVQIDASNTYIQRLTGNIDILESLGLGTTILLRGPPQDSFGAIIFNASTNLTLEAQNGSIYTAAGAFITSNTLNLYAKDNLGTSFEHLNFNSNYLGTITAEQGSIYLDSNNTDVYITANITALLDINIYSQEGYIEVLNPNTLIYSNLGSINLETTTGHITLIGTVSAPNGTLRFWTSTHMDIGQAIRISQDGTYIWNPEDGMTVRWDGGGDKTTWGDPANWDSDKVPAIDDDVIISVNGANVTTAGKVGKGTSVTVHSLTLGLSNGTATCSLTLGAELVVTGDLTIYPNATLVSNASGNITLRGNLTMSYGSFFTHNNGTLIFDGTGAAAHALAVDATLNVFNFTINASQTLNYTGSASFSINGSFVNNGTFNQTSGVTRFYASNALTGTNTFYHLVINPGVTLTAPLSATFNIKGDFTNNGSFDANGGTAVFSGGVQNIYGNVTFNNLTINAGSTFTTSSSITINGTYSNNGSYSQTTAGMTTFAASTSMAGANNFYGLTINQGRVINCTGSVTIWSSTASGYGFINNGTFNQTAGGFTFRASNTLSTTGSYTFNNLTIMNLSGNILTGPLNGSFNVNGNWGASGTYATFDPNGCTVYFTGSGAQTLNAGGAIAIKNFYNIVHSGSGTLSLSGSDILITNNFTNSAGIFNAYSGTNNRSITINGNTYITGGTYRTGTGVNTFGDSSSDTFTLGAGATFEIQSDSLAADGASGDIIMNAGTLTISNNSNVIYDCATAQPGLFLLNKFANYGNLTINSTGSTYTLGANQDINGNFYITAGTLDVSASNYSVNIAGHFANNGTFNPRSGTLVFDGTGNFTDNAPGLTTFNIINIINNSNRYLLTSLKATDLRINAGSALLVMANTLTVTSLTNNGLITTSGSGANLAVTSDNLGSVTFTGAATAIPNKNYGILTLEQGGIWNNGTAHTVDSLVLNAGTPNTLTLNSNLSLTNLQISTNATLAVGASTLTVTTLTNNGLITTSGTGANLLVASDDLGNVTFNAHASAIPNKNYGILTLNQGGTWDNGTTHTINTLYLINSALLLNTDFTSVNMIIETDGILDCTLEVGDNILTVTNLSNYGNITTSGTGANLVIASGDLGNVSFSNYASAIPNKNYNILALDNGGIWNNDRGYVSWLSLAAGTLTLNSNFNSTFVTIESDGILEVGNNALTIIALTNNGLITTSGSGANLLINSPDLGNVTFTDPATAIPDRNYNILTLEQGGIWDNGTDYTVDTLILRASTLTLNSDFSAKTMEIHNGATLEVGKNALAISDLINDGLITNSGAGDNLLIDSPDLGNVTFTAPATAMPNKNYGILTLENGGTWVSGDPKSIGTLNLNGGTLTLENDLGVTNLLIDRDAILEVGRFVLTITSLTNNGLITVSTGDVSKIPFGNVGAFQFTGTNTIPSRTYTTLTLQGTSAVFTLNGEITITNLYINAGTLNANGKTIYVGGNWTNLGSFISGNNTVVFNTAATSVISGNTTFYNFTCTIPGKSIIFASGSTQTILGTLTLLGSKGNLLNLGSSGWSINPKGTINVNYLYVTGGTDLGPTIYNQNSIFINCIGFGQINPNNAQEATQATNTVTPSIDNITNLLNTAIINRLMKNNVSIASGANLVALVEAKETVFTQAKETRTTVIDKKVEAEKNISNNKVIDAKPLTPQEDDENSEAVIISPG